MIKKKIAIAGHSGFIGSNLKYFLRQQGYSIIEINRSDFERDEIFLADKIEKSYAIINLAGEPIIQRWTVKNKRSITDSRLLTTQKLCKATTLMKKKPNIFINASAIGIYEYDSKHDEHSDNYNNSFAGVLVNNWEESAVRNCTNVGKLVIARFGMVLGNEGGAFSQFKEPAKYGFATILGSGKQFISYIHIYDLCNAINFLLHSKGDGGIYNFTTPNPISNKDFNKDLAKRIGKRTVKIPGMFLWLVFGKAADMLLKGQKVYPEKLLKEGFKFKFPTISDIFNDLL